MIGKILDGKYRISRLLGEGGMGAVYEATHTGTGRRVALKLIRGASANRELDVARFQREARAVGAIESQHIVQILDTGIDAAEGVPFIVMEYLVGEDLQTLIARLGPLPPPLVLRIAAQVCSGLHRAHQAGVIHRDIKPANLFLSRRDHGELVARILDFGIAKLTVDHLGTKVEDGLTQSGTLLGSPLYMSPEQAQGLKSVNAATDLWSLGAVMYEALTGRTPHHDADTLGKLIYALCSAPPSPLRGHAPWVPEAVANIVHRALGVAPQDRYPSASAMLADIRTELGQGATMTIEDAMLVTGQPENADLRPPPAESKPGTETAAALTRSGTDPAARRRPGPMALVAIAVSGVALWFLVGSDRHPAPTSSASAPPASRGIPSSVPAAVASATAPPPTETAALPPSGVEAAAIPALPVTTPVAPPSAPAAAAKTKDTRAGARSRTQPPKAAEPTVPATKPEKRTSLTLDKQFQ